MTFFMLSFFLMLSSLALPAFADNGDGWSARARELRLADERAWRLLLHYKPKLFGSGSEISTQEFFLSPRGKTDPAAELEATIRGFFFPPGAAPDRHAICRFPARLAWLSAKPGFDRSALPKISCPSQQRWMSDLAPRSVSLIFASAYLNNPSSMYGHTFLRMDKTGSEGSKLIDHAVNFAAEPDTDNGVLFALYGLIGRFPGRYSAMPYYLKVQEYNNFESRDLWEYPLSLSSAVLANLAAHVWELQDTDFPYYFFNKNCSYQLLPLLEAADPTLNLSPRWPLYVIPADTLRTIMKHKRLVSEPVYRPARMTSALHRRGFLDKKELVLAEAAAQTGDTGPIGSLIKERRALVLESASDYLDLKTHFNPKQESEAAEIRRKLLVARGEAGAAAVREVPRPPPPHEGHATGRISTGWGFGDRKYAELGLRLALHDLLDPETGYAQDSILEMFSIKARYDTESRRAYLRSFDLIRIESLSPRDRWTKKPSWKVDFGARSALELESRPWKAGYFGASGGSGIAAESHILRRESAYLLAEIDGGVGGVFRRSHRIGGGGSAGLVIEALKGWKVLGEASFRSFALGDRRPYARYKGESSLALMKDLSLRGRVERIKKYDEAEISVQIFF